MNDELGRSNTGVGKIRSTSPSFLCVCSPLSVLLTRRPCAYNAQSYLFRSYVTVNCLIHKAITMRSHGGKR